MSIFCCRTPGITHSHFFFPASFFFIHPLHYPSLAIEWPFRDPFKLYLLISYVSSGRIGRISCTHHVMLVCPSVFRAAIVLPEDRKVFAYRGVSIWRHPSD